MKLSVEECLRFGWQQFRLRPWFFIAIPAVFILISIVVGILEAIITSIVGLSAGKFLHFLISGIVNLFFGIGVLSVYLKAHDHVSLPTLKDLWNPKPFWRYLGTSLLLFIIINYLS